MVIFLFRLQRNCFVVKKQILERLYSSKNCFSISAVMLVLLVPRLASHQTQLILLAVQNREKTKNPARTVEGETNKALMSF